MSIVQYEKHKCDCCGEEKDVIAGKRPIGWLTVSVTEWSLSIGEGVLNKEVCSRKCVLKILKELKKIPGRKSKKMICHL